MWPPSRCPECARHTEVGYELLAVDWSVWVPVWCAVKPRAGGGQVGVWCSAVRSPDVIAESICAAAEVPGVVRDGGMEADLAPASQRRRGTMAVAGGG